MLPRKEERKRNNEVLRHNWKVSFKRPAPVGPVQHSLGITGCGRERSCSPQRAQAAVTAPSLPIIYFTAVSRWGSWFSSSSVTYRVYSSEVCAKARELLSQFMATGALECQLSPEPLSPSETGRHPPSDNLQDLP